MKKSLNSKADSGRNAANLHSLGLFLFPVTSSKYIAGFYSVYEYVLKWKVEMGFEVRFDLIRHMC